MLRPGLPFKLETTDGNDVLERVGLSAMVERQEASSHLSPCLGGYNPSCLLGNSDLVKLEAIVSHHTSLPLALV